LDHTSKKYTVEQAQQPNKLHDLFGNYDALVADSIITEHDANDTQNAMTQKDERGKLITGQPEVIPAMQKKPGTDKNVQRKSVKFEIGQGNVNALSKTEELTNNLNSNPEIIDPQNNGNNIQALGQNNGIVILGQ
jgi:hypothetical protein